MTFLNWAMLFGLAAVAIPILIHLLNRSRARVIDWGAMRFLEASLASRSRRILIEEIVLMALRCLVMALAALAVARPFLPTRPTALAVLVGPAVLGAAVCAALAAAMWSNRRARRWLVAAMAALLALPPAAGAIEQAYQGSVWSFGGGQKDVAIVLDGSTSMELSFDGNTNFSRAISEARAVAAGCGPGDGVSLVLAGPAPRAVLGNPTSNRRDVETALGELRPAGGAMRVVPALQAAARSLEAGANPAKKIVLVTDGQHVGWDVRAEAAWRMLAATLKRHVAPPQIIIRALPVPGRFTNLAVADVTLDRRVVGTDREVGVHVKLAATGTEPARGRAVRLFVDGQPAGSREVAHVPGGAAETVLFRHRFAGAGRHIVTARLTGGDDLAADDEARRVVDVLAALPVLIVDGTPSMAPLEGAGDFLDIALAPPGEDDRPPGPRGRDGKDRDDYASCLVSVRVVAAPDVASAGDLGRYAVVVLADVPLLPKEWADGLARFVREGGGLLVTPGPTVRPEFYNAWADEAGRPVLPGKLARLCTVADKPVRLSLHTFTHPGLAKVADEEQSDAASAAISSYWRVEPPEKDRDVSVGGQLETGEPLLLERRLGKGAVLLAATAFHRRHTNLPALQCFVPLVHELVYCLAAPAVADCNVESGADVTIELRPASAEGRTGAGLRGEYFKDPDLRTPALTRTDARIDFNWGSGAPHPSVPTDNFSVRWSGRVEAPRDGTYTFHTTGDDGVRLWVDGKLVIDDWNAHGPEQREGQVRLAAGRKADLRLEYFDAGDVATVKLEWSGPGLGREVVPPARLFADAPPAGPQLIRGEKLDVMTPSGQRRQAVVARVDAPARVTFTDTQEPGLYRLMLPRAAAERYAGMSPDANGVPFVVVDSLDESALALLTDADLQTAREHLLGVLADADPRTMLARVEATNELTAAVGGGIPGRELWRMLAVVLGGALLAEIALTRWIAVQRRAHIAPVVSFGADAVDLQAFRRRVRELVAPETAAGAQETAET